MTIQTYVSLLRLIEIPKQLAFRIFDGLKLVHNSFSCKSLVFGALNVQLYEYSGN